MKMKTKRMNLLIALLMATGYYLIFKYHDQKVFQDTLAFLFNPDERFALPKKWQDNRLLVFGGLLVLLFLHYSSIAFSIKKLHNIYCVTQERKDPPVLPVVSASYHYKQDKTNCLVTWIINTCYKKGLTLHYQRGSRPWSISHRSDNQEGIFDEKIVDIMFQKEEKIQLDAVLSDPNPVIKESADELFKVIKSDNCKFFKCKKSSFPAWILFMVMITEIPFYMASFDGPANPGLLVIVLLSSLFFVLPVYAWLYELPALLGGRQIISYIKIAAAFLFSFLGLFMLFSSSHNGGHYLATAFAPNLSATLIIFVICSPLTPNDETFLSQIIGYRKHLLRDGYQIREKDLPWTLGLEIHSDIIESTFQYADSEIPEWLESENNKTEVIMKLLHQTLENHVNSAINGKMKNRSRLRSGHSKNRF